MIYLVSSQEKHIIVDAIFTDKEKAIKYCESRINDKYDWTVHEVTPTAEGTLWWDWKVIHRTKRK